jgi:hypothetical protein
VGLASFGGEITGCRCFAGFTIPSAGRLGCHFGTDRWAAGECFRYGITTVDAPSVADDFVPHRRSGWTFQELQ